MPHLEHHLLQVAEQARPHRIDPILLVGGRSFALVAFASWTILFPHGGSASVTFGSPADEAGPVRGFRVPYRAVTSRWGAPFPPS
ncbi:hypothetical protein GCM10010430_51180 [Kitasatospora cystarginea]|uniref:Uncharacterized protein n=1 Tax=Kitasatospora cystarginea TaxID=58350 RepID=A0ABP5RI06_9ACTN